MKANVRLIKSKRQFSIDFKKELVSEFETGKFSVKELSKLHGIAYQSIYQWIYKYSKYNEKGYRVIEMKDSSEQKIKGLQDRLKELERVVGKKQIMIDYLETMIEVAKEELDFDIKKNFDTHVSKNSKKTKIK